MCVRLSNQMNSGASIEKSGRGQEARFRPWRRGKGRWAPSQEIAFPAVRRRQRCRIQHFFAFFFLCSEDKDTKVDWFVFMLRCLSFSVCSIRIERKISPDLI